MANAQYDLSTAATRLPTLSATASMLVAALRRLADDLELHDRDDVDGYARFGAFADAALNGAENALDDEELDFLQRIDALVLLTGVEPDTVQQ